MLDHPPRTDLMAGNPYFPQLWYQGPKDMGQITGRLMRLMACMLGTWKKYIYSSLQAAQIYKKVRQHIYR